MKRFYFIYAALITVISCATPKPATVSSQKNSVSDKSTPTVNSDLGPYHPAPTKLIDIIHTKLDVSFDWNKQYLNGKATITLRPYFYPITTVTLDAKNFDVNAISFLNEAEKKLAFTNDKSQLIITLDKAYKRTDTIKLLIDYVAKTNERKLKAGKAITSDKGLYFINPLNQEKNKPSQIWTQGEPESNSCWFPTVDKPNERMTQEIYITIDSVHKSFVTLSNGLLISSKKNPDSSRTDYWKQSLPAAPYLTMMAIGDFAIVKDKWRNLDVNYYIEHKYEPYAKLTFGNTPEMLEFYSTKLGVTYPWEKFSQIVVRDYVSGAMENTSAVLHGSFLNQTDREHLDRDYEDVISHELFHQWFGDYVTCEQWSNITLNEGFATYGEYLWREYKYGRDAADLIGYESMQGYFQSAGKFEKPLIRYHYNEPDDVFDAFSYNKGAAVLHMLRKYIGDDAFFSALKLYLNKNKFTSVEATNLRLAFEEVTGEDLHWFFNQWFFEKGHPKLVIKHSYSDSSKKYFIHIEQKQDLTNFPVFKLPVDIDIYIDGGKERKRIWIKNAKEDFSFDVTHQPDFVNVDAEKALLCEKEEKHTITEYVFEYKNCPLYEDRMEALKGCAPFASIHAASDVILSAMHDKSYDLRERAIVLTENFPKEDSAKIKNVLIELAQKDSKASVRQIAIEQLSRKSHGADVDLVYKQAMDDQSYSVSGAALAALSKTNPKEAMGAAKKYESIDNVDLLLAIAHIYSTNGTDENQNFFLQLSDRIDGWKKIDFLSSYTTFLKRCKDGTVNAGLPVLEKIARDEQNRWISQFGQNEIKELLEVYKNREEGLALQLSGIKDKTSEKVKTLDNELKQTHALKEKLQTMFDSFTDKE